MFQDEKLVQLVAIHRFVFLGLISMADDAGRLLDNVKFIDGTLFSATDETCRESLELLAAINRITRYVTDSGQKVIQIVNWARHQKVDHPSTYVLPSKPEKESVANVSRESREDLALRSWTLDHGPTTKDLSTTASDETAVRPSLLEVDNRIVEYTRRVREKTASKNDLMTLRIAVLFSYWAAKFQHGSRVLLDRKRESRLRTRLKENGGNLSELLYAVDGAARDDWLIEKGLTGIETIFRDRGTVEKYSQRCTACVNGEMHAMEQHITGVQTPAPAQLQVVN